jgi:hypothetical protein
MLKTHNNSYFPSIPSLPPHCPVFPSLLMIPFGILNGFNYFSRKRTNLIKQHTPSIQNRTGDGFICVYSIASISSFQELVGFRDQIWRAKGSRRVPIVITGNKCDLEDGGEREVHTDVGALFAERSNALFVETRLVILFGLVYMLYFDVRACVCLGMGVRWANLSYNWSFFPFPSFLVEVRRQE